MLPYLFLMLFSIGIPFAFCIIVLVTSNCEYQLIAPKKNSMTIFLFFLGFFILLALRDITVGRDLYEYQSIFEICYNSSFKNLFTLRWELGYTIFNKLISFISKEYRFFLIIIAIIVLIPIYVLYSKEKKYSILLIILFMNMPCFLIIFSALRQSMAVSIGILSYLAIEKKKHILGFILILLASLFHISAIVLFLIYPAFFFKIKTKHLLYIIPVAFIIYIFKVQIFTFVINLMPKHYVEYYGDVQQTQAFGTMILFLLFSIFAFVILDEEIMSQKDYFMRNILLIATVFQFFVPINGLIQRASYYFIIFIPVALVSIVKAPKRMLKNISDIAVVVLVVFFALYFFYNAIFSTDNLLDVFPYKFCW